MFYGIKFWKPLPSCPDLTSYSFRETSFCEEIGGGHVMENNDNLMQWRRQGGTEGTSPPEIEKNCCIEMLLFPKAIFLATTFQKIAKNSIFLMNFYQTISKLSQNFPIICIFRPNERKINAQFLKFC